MLPRALGSLLGLALLAGATGCGLVGGGDEDDARPAALGEVLVDPDGTGIEGRPSYVLLPHLRYDFVVSSPADRLPSLTAAEASVDEQADDGTAFVAVGWGASSLPGRAAVLQDLRADVPATAVLVVDGEEHDLGDLADGSGAHVVVPDDARDVSLEVTYDGRSQTVDDVHAAVPNHPARPALPYRSTPDVTEDLCPDPQVRAPGRPGSGFAGPDCYLQWTGPVAYHGATGWARSGRAWVVVSVRVGPVFGFDRSGNLTITGRDGTLRLEGAAGPAELVPGDDEDPGRSDDGTWRARAVFDVPDSWSGGTLVVRRDYDAAPDPTSGGADGRGPVTFRRAFALDV